jgi:hypothetical protein
MPKVMLWPTKANAMNVRHPSDGLPKIDGCLWENDGFTARMLTDGIFTLDRAKAWAGNPLAPQPEMDTMRVDAPRATKPTA